jgi:hypothetical protein
MKILSNFRGDVNRFYEERINVTRNQMTGMTISSDREVDDLSQVMVSPYRDAYAHGACEDVEGGEDIAMGDQ